MGKLPIAVMLGLVLATAAGAAVISDGAGLSANWDGQTLSGLKLGGRALEGVTARVALQDPRTDQPADAAQFKLTCELAGRDGALWLTGLVTAAGEEDAVADLVLRWEGVSLPTGNGDTDLLLATKLVNKLPLCPLRCLGDGSDALAMAVPADDPVVYAFKGLPGEKAVEMRLPLGFTRDAAPALRMQAPFAIVLFQTNPRWHFRSALAQYYRLFPTQFKRLEHRDGGWFFANEVPQIPNPQHFAFFEGLGDPQVTHARGLGMYPYSETSSETIHLPGPGLSKGYDEAVAQLEALENARAPERWEMSGGVLDEQVAHGGRFSYRATAEKPGSAFARQIVPLAPNIHEPVVVEGWSKADKVGDDGNPNNYSIYVDCLLADGSYQFGQCATFRGGTHDWEKATFVIQPRQPLADLRVYAMFRNRTGTAWFDDVRLYRQSKPDENLIANTDFETLGKRADIQYCRDNALTDAEGRYRFVITDNLAADIPPAHPLSLLRFACNVDPDWRAPEGRPTPCSRAVAMFDNFFANMDIDGAYIDSVCAWCVWYLNFRRDHWPAATSLFTYDPATFKVAQAGKLAMVKYLRFIGERYHPQGKTIFGNMGPSTAAWDNYPVLDIIGIESSQFRDRALMGYHRFGGYHKPVLPMNFVNLHHLDDRATAEEFVLASAQWGEFPSTGRYVREGYTSYGDVCHSYYPALVEMSRAGWEPEPLCEGARAERFGTKEPLYFAIRAPRDARQADLLILKEALGAIKDPVVMDAVQLTPVPAKLTPQGLSVGLADGADVLTILRVSSAENARGWLLERAALHCEWASRVRAPAPYTPRLQALAAELRKAVPGSASILLAAFIKRLQSEEATAEAEPDSLEKTSLLYELRDAERALAERLLADGGASLKTAGAALTPVSQPASVTVTFTPGTTGAKLLGSWGEDGRNILRRQHEKIPADLAPPGQAVVLRRNQPGAGHVISAIEVPIAGAAPVIVLRAQNVFFTPVVTARVERAADPAGGGFVYKVAIERLTPPTALTVKATGAGAQVEPAQVVLKPQESVAQFCVKALGDSTEVVQLRFAVEMNGQEVAQANSEFRNLPMPPPNPLATLAKGATATADSSYSGYSPEVAIDGVWETTGLHWTQRAWASQDAARDEGHWLEIKLPKPTAIAQAWLYWAIDDNLVFSSRNYDIETWDGKGWQPAAQVRDNPLSTVTVSKWAPRTTDRVRIHQLKSGGAARRPEIMWVTEVGLY